MVKRLRDRDKENVPSNSGKRSYLVPAAMFVGVILLMLGVNTRAIIVTAQKSAEHDVLVREAEHAKELSLWALVSFKKQVQE